MREVSPHVSSTLNVGRGAGAGGTVGRRTGTWTVGEDARGRTLVFSSETARADCSSSFHVPGCVWRPAGGNTRRTPSRTPTSSTAVDARIGLSTVAPPSADLGPSRLGPATCALERARGHAGDRICDVR